MGICSAEDPAPAEAEGWVKGQVGGAAIEGAGAKGEAAAEETAAPKEPAPPADKAADAADKK